MTTINPIWLCPDLRNYWVIMRDRTTQQFLLKAKHASLRHTITDVEGLAIQHFTGQYTVRQVQRICQKKHPHISNDSVQQLWQKLVLWGVLSLDELTECEPSSPAPAAGPQLKDCVQWIQTEAGHWILRNPEDVTFVQLNDAAKQVVDQLGTDSVQAIAQTYGIAPGEMRSLLQQLAVTGMLVGTSPPQPKKKKFTPMQLLFFKLSLWNPESFLDRHIEGLRWIWTQRVWLLLCAVFALTGAIALHQRDDLLWTSQQFLSHLNGSIILTFAVLSLTVVTLHELGHAFTLKHYGGVVPEVGLMFMFLMPVAYTNTSDQYALPRRSQRLLVVGAGVLCQLIIATIGFWVWNSSATGTWLWTLSYLLFAASIFTVAINLNPLAKFDGYYLTVAATGINNLRQRSFQFYGNLLKCQPIGETEGDRWILAGYAPFSLLYTLSIFGFLFLNVANIVLTHIPFTALILLAVWAVYFYLTPDPQA